MSFSRGNILLLRIWAKLSRISFFSDSSTRVLGGGDLLLERLAIASRQRNFGNGKAGVVAASAVQERNRNNSAERLYFLML